VEVYYERLFKLTNSLRHRTINNFIITIFKSRLQPYLRLATTCMKRKNLQKHKETTLVCEEGIYENKS
jgi:hypothetical protein